MIKNQRLHAQWDDAPVHERSTDIDVIAFGQADLIDDRKVLDAQLAQHKSVRLALTPF